jgi:protein-L-isoaspartate(D-aspartate) O-methyltransferase
MHDEELFGRARQEMVEHQIKRRGIKDELVLAAFQEIPRHVFIEKTHHQEAYEDHPLPIGHGQTISQPFIVALMTERLQLTGDEKVLEVGTGSGYQAAILARLAHEVHSVERIPELAQQAKENLQVIGLSNVTVHVGDGTLGWPPDATYDAIMVTAGTPVMPEALVEQLTEGGRLIAPVGSRWRQILELWIKHEGKIEKEEVLPVVFVPLIGKQGWEEYKKDSL